MLERSTEAHAENCNCQTCWQFRRIAELEQQNKTFRAAMKACETCDEGLFAESEALREDANRYRWLRANEWDSPIIVMGYDSFSNAQGTELDAAVDAAMNLMKDDKRDDKRLDWLQSMHTLHGAVEILYVIDGYEITLTNDGNPVGDVYKGKTLRDAIDLAMKK